MAGKKTKTAGILEFFQVLGRDRFHKTSHILSSCDSQPVQHTFRCCQLQHVQWNVLLIRSSNKGSHNHSLRQLIRSLMLFIYVFCYILLRSVSSVSILGLILRVLFPVHQFATLPNVAEILASRLSEGHESECVYHQIRGWYSRSRKERRACTTF